MQCLGKQRLAVQVKPARKLRCQVLGIGGTAPVATEKDFAALLKGRYDLIHYAYHDGQQAIVVQHRLFHGDAVE